MSPAEFSARYVRRRVPVILEGCSSHWPANSWSLSALLGGEDSHREWNVDFKTNLSGFSINKTSLSGENITNIRESNGTIRIFDPISRRLHTNLRREGNQELSDKMHLFSDYSTPDPIPRDLYDRAGILTDFQWIIISDKWTGED